MPQSNYDYIIIGAGIIGLNIARALLNKFPNCNILILEKETAAGSHSSGRNSGVLHAGFYYTADSLKAQFTRLGNTAMTKYCDLNGLTINKCGKVVVAKNEDDLTTLYELYNRGQSNDSGISLIDEEELRVIEPNAKTYQQALFSPHTSTIDPKQVVNSMLNELMAATQITIKFDEGYKASLGDNTILTTANNKFCGNMIINAAGLYADTIAKDFGFAANYVIIPFKGIYLKYSGNNLTIKRNIYPVPNIRNPFLGVHFTVTANQEIKIGPTAIPVLWREGYSGLSKFKLKEFLEIMHWESKLFIKNSFNFRNLAMDEIKKYYRPHLLKLASSLVHNLDPNGFTTWSTPGIRAQLLNKNTLELVQDFVIEGDRKSVHVLNAVSPGFTCSIPFATWIVDKYIC